MRIAVITPYANESYERLQRCHESVKQQTQTATHILVADGAPLPGTETWDADRLTIPGPNRDGGSLARGIGALQAMAQGYDAIAFLDSDNWYALDHLESLTALLARTQAVVGVAQATLYRTDGSLMAEAGPPDPNVVIDTSCFFLTRPAFALLPIWLNLPRETIPDASPAHRDWSVGGLVCDRIFTLAIKLFRVPLALNDHSTVNYTVKSAFPYTRRGEKPPDGARDDADLLKAGAWWASLTPNERARFALCALPRKDRPPTKPDG
jgi:glycosyltransferase involved in cell wall biosynthesis